MDDTSSFSEDFARRVHSILTEFESSRVYAWEHLSEAMFSPQNCRSLVGFWPGHPSKKNVLLLEAHIKKMKKKIIQDDARDYILNKIKGGKVSDDVKEEGDHTDLKEEGDHTDLKEEVQSLKKKVKLKISLYEQLSEHITDLKEEQDHPDYNEEFQLLERRLKELGGKEWNDEAELLKKKLEAYGKFLALAYPPPSSSSTYEGEHTLEVDEVVQRFERIKGLGGKASEDEDKHTPLKEVDDDEDASGKGSGGGASSVKLKISLYEQLLLEHLKDKDEGGASGQGSGGASSTDGAGGDTQTM